VPRRPLIHQAETPLLIEQLIGPHEESPCEPSHLRLLTFMQRAPDGCWTTSSCPANRGLGYTKPNVSGSFEIVDVSVFNRYVTSRRVVIQLSEHRADEQHKGSRRIAE
jgi:hypothetical protein